jgi:hypothetical protein
MVWEGRKEGRITLPARPVNVTDSDRPSFSPSPKLDYARKQSVDDVIQLRICDRETQWLCT